MGGIARGNGGREINKPIGFGGLKAVARVRQDRDSKRRREIIDLAEKLASTPTPDAPAVPDERRPIGHPQRRPARARTQYPTGGLRFRRQRAFLEGIEPKLQKKVAPSAGIPLWRLPCRPDCIIRGGQYRVPRQRRSGPRRPGRAERLSPLGNGTGEKPQALTNRNPLRGRWPPIKIIATSGRCVLGDGDLPSGGLFLKSPTAPGRFPAPCGTSRPRPRRWRPSLVAPKKNPRAS
jgi:hypothetical protein